MRTNRSCLFKAYYSKGVSPHDLRVAETPRQEVRWKSFIVEGAEEASGVLWLEDMGMGKLEVG